MCAGFNGLAANANSTLEPNTVDVSHIQLVKTPENAFGNTRLNLEADDVRYRISFVASVSAFQGEKKVFP